MPNPNERVKDPETTLLLFGSQPLLKNGKISGRAIHPVTTFHNEFPVLREFVGEYLEKAINDSVFPIPINVDHGIPLDFTKNKITELQWNPEKMEVEYFGEVDDQVEEDIKNGLYKNGVSIEIGFPPGSSIEFVNGSTAIARAIPKGFKYKAVSLLRDMSPSDPTTSLRVWNNAVKTLQSQNQGKKTVEKPSDAQILGLKVFREYGRRLKQQGMTKDEILAKIGELEKQNQEIMDQLYPEAELTEEQRNELNVKSEQLWTEIEAYREALAALTVEEVLEVVILEPEKERPTELSTVNQGENPEVKEEEQEDKGDSSQPEQEKQPEKKPETEKKVDEESTIETGDEESPKPEEKPEKTPEEEKKENIVGEAILGSEAGDPSVPLGFVSVEKLERILPHPRQHIPWGVRTHLVDPLRRLIYEAKKEVTHSG
jgi:hypothetical protein